ncbi:hypothetical protein Trydic_g21643 [Trypoxylus dichotomus]
MPDKEQRDVELQHFNDTTQQNAYRVKDITDINNTTRNISDHWNDLLTIHQTMHGQNQKKNYASTISTLHASEKLSTKLLLPNDHIPPFQNSGVY